MLTQRKFALKPLVWETIKLNCGLCGPRNDPKKKHIHLNCKRIQTKIVVGHHAPPAFHNVQRSMFTTPISTVRDFVSVQVVNRLRSILPNQKTRVRHFFYNNVAHTRRSCKGIFCLYFPLMLITQIN